MPEKYLSEIQGKPSIKLYCFTLDTPPESRVLLGSGEEPLRHRGESCSIYILIVSTLQVLLLALRIVLRK